MKILFKFSLLIIFTILLFYIVNKLMTYPNTTVNIMGFLSLIFGIYFIAKQISQTIKQSLKK